MTEREPKAHYRVCAPLTYVRLLFFFISCASYICTRLARIGWPDWGCGCGCGLVTRLLTLDYRLSTLDSRLPTLDSRRTTTNPQGTKTDRGPCAILRPAGRRRRPTKRYPGPLNLLWTESVPSQDGLSMSMSMSWDTPALASQRPK